jgi:lipoprotein signal peptidase
MLGCEVRGATAWRCVVRHNLVGSTSCGGRSSFAAPKRPNEKFFLLVAVGNQGNAWMRGSGATAWRSVVRHNLVGSTPVVVVAPVLHQNAQTKNFFACGGWKPRECLDARFGCDSVALRRATQPRRLDVLWWSLQFCSTKTPKRKIFLLVAVGNQGNAWMRGSGATAWRSVVRHNLVGSTPVVVVAPVLQHQNAQTKNFFACGGWKPRECLDARFGCDSVALRRATQPRRLDVLWWSLQFCSTKTPKRKIFLLVAVGNQGNAWMRGSGATAWRSVVRHNLVGSTPVVVVAPVLQHQNAQTKNLEPRECLDARFGCDNSKLRRATQPRRLDACCGGRSSFAAPKRPNEKFFCLWRLEAKGMLGCEVRVRQRGAASCDTTSSARRPVVVAPVLQHQNAQTKNFFACGSRGMLGCEVPMRQQQAASCDTTLLGLPAENLFCLLFRCKV